MKRTGISNIDLHQLTGIVEWWENDSLHIDSNQHVLLYLKNTGQIHWLQTKISMKSTNDFHT